MPQAARMSPETTLLAVNAVFLAFAYGAVYPAMERKSLKGMARADLAITGAALLVAGLLFAGTGTGFSLLVLTVPWWAFSLGTKTLMELPLLLWFKRRHGLSLGDDE